MEYAKHYIAPTMEDGGIVILELDETRTVVCTTNSEPVFYMEELEKIQSRRVIHIEIITDGMGKWQLVASAISNGKETLRWYENYRLWSRWLAPWKTVEIVVKSSRYEMFPHVGGSSTMPANSAWAADVKGSMEFVFFRDVLMIVDEMRFTEAFINECKLSKTYQNGKLYWNRILGDDINSYTIALGKIARLLKVAVKHYAMDCSRIEKLLTQSEGICALRMTEIQHLTSKEVAKASRGQQHVVNMGGPEEHNTALQTSTNNTQVPTGTSQIANLPTARKVRACSLDHWNTFRDYLRWIIDDAKSQGHAGSPPNLYRPESPLTPQKCQG